MQINSKGKHEDHDFYRLTAKGMRIVQYCISNTIVQNGFKEHNSCCLKDLYLSVGDESEISSTLPLITVEHSYQFQTIYYNLRSRTKAVPVISNINQGTSVTTFKRKSGSLEFLQNNKVPKFDTIYEKQPEGENHAKTSAIQTDKNPVQKGQKNQVQCKVCKKSFKKSLLGHLAKAQECRKFYNDIEYESLKSDSEQKSFIHPIKIGTNGVIVCVVCSFLGTSNFLV